MELPAGVVIAIIKTAQACTKTLSSRWWLLLSRLVDLAGIFGIDPSEGPAVPHVLVGTTDAMCEALQERRERWDMSYIICQGDAVDTMAPVVAKLAGT